MGFACGLERTLRSDDRADLGSDECEMDAGEGLDLSDLSDGNDGRDVEPEPPPELEAE